jgi:hypothetical protein
METSRINEYSNKHFCEDVYEGVKPKAVLHPFDTDGRFDLGHFEPWGFQDYCKPHEYDL